MSATAVDPRALAGLLDALAPAERAEVDQLLTALATLGDDPLARLLDPGFTETLWEYEPSRVGPMLPGSLHPKQLAVLKSQARFRWLFWGNQVGKTTVGAVDTNLLVLGRHPYRQFWEPPISAWASALTWELWENILLPELLTWLPDDRILDAPEPYKHSTKRHILVKADNGAISRITGKAAEQGAARYQSARIHHFWGDEEHPEDVWNEVQPRLVRFGGQAIKTMTPLKGLTWMYRRIYVPAQKGETRVGEHFISHAGLRDNPSITPEALATLREQFKHNPAQLAAREEGRFVKPEGLVLRFDADRHLVPMDPTHLRALIARGQPFGGTDFGAWRFAFTLWVADEAGRALLIDEVFSQRETSDTRALAICRALVRWGIRRMPHFWGDCANPQDIMELNAAFQRLAADASQPEPIRAVARALVLVGVAAENKVRRAGVQRMEDLLGRDALLVRRGMADDQVWRLGWNASRQGDPMTGSRWLWEVDNWHYPKTDDGKLQKDDPDDASADGGDMMAASRYALMSWWRATEPAAPPPRSLYDAEHRHPGYAREDGRLVPGRPATTPTAAPQRGPNAPLARTPAPTWHPAWRGTPSRGR